MSQFSLILLFNIQYFYGLLLMIYAKFKNLCYTLIKSITKCTSPILLLPYYRTNYYYNFLVFVYIVTIYSYFLYEVILMFLFKFKCFKFMFLEPIKNFFYVRLIEIYIIFLLYLFFQLLLLLFIENKCLDYNVFQCCETLINLCIMKIRFLVIFFFYLFFLLKLKHGRLEL